MSKEVPLVATLKNLRNPAGELYLKKHMADQLFRWIEIVENMLEGKDEIIQTQTELIEMYKSNGGKNAFTQDDPTCSNMPGES